MKRNNFFLFFVEGVFVKKVEKKLASYKTLGYYK